VRKNVRPAVTHYRVKERFRVNTAVDRRRPNAAWDLSLLDIRLETGRTHQIRVHFAAIGHPIVGDSVYGPGRPKLGAGRQMLHAARLRLDHPVTHEPLAIESPWPLDFEQLVARLRSGRAA
jgi:23S rRNA pseudouridine1911/1915/1917 synthase